jgi:hypothetical protein
MTDEHALRSECAANFGRLHAEITALKGEDGVSRDEFRILRESITHNHSTIMAALSLVREDVSALKVKASLWGALGGAITAGIAALLAVLSSALR